jgi:glutathione S-transferase
MIRIHNFARGLRGLRVMWLCEELGLAYQVAAVSFPPSAAYRTLHPLGSVPFLEDDDGVAISESIAMLLYLRHRYGPTPLLPVQDAPRLARVLQMAELGEATIASGINPLLVARFTAPEAQRRNWSVHSQEQRIAAAVDYAAGQLGGQAFFAGDALTLADISMSPALSLWSGVCGQTLPENLRTFQERVTARAAYQRARGRCDAAA